MKQNKRNQDTELLDVRKESDLPPEMRASIQKEPLQEMWSLHQKALQLGDSVREARGDMPASALSSQGYLNRLESRLALRKEEQKRKAWWRRLSQITWSGVAVAASVAVLWWVPNKVELDLKTTAQLNQKHRPQQAMASAKKDNTDLWLQRLGGSVMDDNEERDTTAQYSLDTFVNADGDDIAPISQELPGSLEDLSVLSPENE
ncbi:MAG: hypothetical protein H6728_13710 [Myxococcales bacterium]|nr:hypothetical protein [Myxococcales bacterium]MCB9644127.1 hypothetical protein [Myxococcales bacterium]